MSRKFLVPLQLPADPVNPLEAVTKQYADGMIVIAAADPIAANPSCELWVDTTTVATTVPLPAGMPRGWIGQAWQTSSPSVTAEVDIPGCAVTWVADPSRRYLTMARLGMRQNATAGEQYLFIADVNGVHIVLGSAAGSVIANGYCHLSSFVVDSGLSGTVTRKIRGQVVGGAATPGAGEYAASILVQDIGGT